MTMLELQTIPNVGPAVGRRLVAAVDDATGAPVRPWWEPSRERRARADG